MNDSTIGVFLTQEQLVVVSQWISHLQGNNPERPLTDVEKDLVIKFQDSLKFISEINS